MSKSCYSCGAPLDDPTFRCEIEDYCRYCVDASGSLRPREQVRRNVAEWFKTWQPGLTDEKAYERAGYYMRSMPAWAEETA